MSIKKGNKEMSQGTISVLFGCHSVIHSVLVLIAWIKIYKNIPKFWEIVCIFIHDIGHFGLNYLDDFEQKKIHWKLGAKIGKKLFGQKGFYFLAGHCSYSGYEKSKLYKADKYSWYIAPTIWLISNNIFEPKLYDGFSNLKSVREFQKQVKRSIEENKYISTHEFYLNRKGAIS